MPSQTQLIREQLIREQVIDSSSYHGPYGLDGQTITQMNKKTNSKSKSNKKRGLVFFSFDFTQKGLLLGKQYGCNCKTRDIKSHPEKIIYKKWNYFPHIIEADLQTTDSTRTKPILNMTERVDAKKPLLILSVLFLKVGGIRCPVFS